MSIVVDVALYNRLYNYKFTQAMNLINRDRDSDEVQTLVYALHMVCGDAGVGITEGYFGSIILAALRSIGINDDDND